MTQLCGCESVFQELQLDPDGIAEHSRGSLRKQRTPGSIGIKIGIPKGMLEPFQDQRFSHPSRGADFVFRR